MVSFESIRTRFRDILFGRPRIIFLREDEQEREVVEPIFILGTFRSGTTLLRYLLDTHSRMCCPPETKFLLHLAALRGDEGSVRALKSMGFDETSQRRFIRDFSDRVFENYMKSKNKVRWADKTPEYVRILDFVEWLYGPNCKYVLIYRNGLDVAHSMNSTYISCLEPDKTINKAFEYWAHDTEILHSWETTHSDRCVSVKYENLSRTLESEMRRIFEFLGEEWEDEILKWYEHGHDMGDEDIKARRQRQLRLSFGHFSEWDPKLRNELIARSRELHEKIGYNPSTLQPIESGS